jgi:2-C-methyl-D-erythritol 4-phosphate cytidylyltransferase
VAPPGDGPTWALVLAAGRGRRYGGPTPKQFELLAGERVLDRSLATARSVADHVVVVLAPGEEAEGERLVDVGAADAAVVVVHDAARPLASPALHRAVVHAVRLGADAAIPGVPVTDTIKRVHPAPGALGAGVEGLDVVVETVARDELVAVQTPQAFRADVLRRAHAGAPHATDDAALVEGIGGTVVVVAGEPANLKITGPGDLAVAEVLLALRDGGAIG